MTPLPPPLGSGELVFWRLDQAKFGLMWNSGEGSFRVGGRWSSSGARAVYAALDPAAAILEVAVHKTFRVLDIVAHVLTRARIVDASKVHIVNPEDVPNPNWLRPGVTSAGQRAFGDALLGKHPFVVIPSVVSTHSWNVLFDPALAEGLYDAVAQEPFALDTRLHPAVGS
ncbi:MAG TPA: RES domain-containing protein [Rhizomicrobium sp.]|nr:RES domain-containing protein [Rhizomicrobium sp.]